MAEEGSVGAPSVVGPVHQQGGGMSAGKLPQSAVPAGGGSGSNPTLGGAAGASGARGPLEKVCFGMVESQIIRLSLPTYKATLGGSGQTRVLLYPKTVSGGFEFLVKNAEGALLGLLERRMADILVPLLSSCTAWACISGTPFNSKSAAILISLFGPYGKLEQVSQQLNSHGVIVKRSTAPLRGMRHVNLHIQRPSPVPRAVERPPAPGAPAVRGDAGRPAGSAVQASAAPTAPKRAPVDSDPSRSQAAAKRPNLGPLESGEQSSGPPVPASAPIVDETSEVQDVTLLKQEGAKKALDAKVDARTEVPDDDEDEVQLTGIKLPPPAPPTPARTLPATPDPEEMVCYGMVQCNLEELHLPRYLACFPPPTRICHVEIFPRDIGIPYVWDFLVMRGSEQIGVMSRKLARSLSPMVSFCKVSASLHLDHLDQRRGTASMQLTLFGPFRQAMLLGTHLLQHGEYLRHITAPVLLRYFNPQLAAQFPGAPRITPSATLDTPGTAETAAIERQAAAAEALRSQIEMVYNSLVAAENLPAAEPDPRLIATLYKHQKQALHFMVERERVVDFETVHSPLWKRLPSKQYLNTVTGERSSVAPQLARGGILADDMGLGKTIELISLLLKNQRPGYLTRPVPERRGRLPVPSQFKRKAAAPGASTSSSAAPVTLKQQQPPAPVEGAEDEFDDLIDLTGAAEDGGDGDGDGAEWQEDRDRKGKSSLFLLQPPTSITASRSGDNGTDEDPEMVPSNATLIVCPLSTLGNWEEQIALHVAPGSLRVHVHHGAQRTTDPRHLARFDVVITTYNVLALEFNRVMRNGGRVVHSPLQLVHWHRVALDEAHIIKDINTGQSRAACALVADCRWCLTGTPIQNRLSDLYSLIKFLAVPPFNDLRTWNHFIGKPIKNQMASIGVSRLQTVMKALTLRRTKTQKIDDKPILHLPPRVSSVYRIDLNASEREMYDKERQEILQRFDALVAEGSVMKNYVHILAGLLRLRQLCTHPLLCRNVTEDIAAAKLGEGDDQPFTQEKAASMLALLRETGEELCSFCGKFVDGRERIAHVSKCGHLYCHSCVAAVFRFSVSLVCSVCQSSMYQDALLEVREAEEAEEGLAPLATGLGGGATALQSSKVRALLDDLVAARQEALQEGTGVVKSVIFSQWTNMLELLKKPLQEAGFRYVSLDGRMSREARASALLKFREDESVTIILCSLKAAGVGISLVSACRVYMMEPYWNPASEKQAVDRVHRLGQTRPVKTIHFIVNDSIEEGILEMQQDKLLLSSMTFNEEEEEEAEDAEDAGYDGGGGRDARARAAERAARKQRRAELKARDQNKKMANLKRLLRIPDGEGA